MRADQHPSPFSGKLPEREPASVVALRTEIPGEELELLSGAERRILRLMWIFGALGFLSFLLWKGWSWSLGFALGAGLSILNFEWLRSAVNAIASALATLPPQAPYLRAQPIKQPRHWLAIARFLLRYALIGLAGYAIFLSSAISLAAFMVGLFLAVAALMAEAVYQVVHELNTSSRVK